MRRRLGRAGSPISGRCRCAGPSPWSHSAISRWGSAACFSAKSEIELVMDASLPVAAWWSGGIRTPLVVEKNSGANPHRADVTKSDAATQPWSRSGTGCAPVCHGALSFDHRTWEVFPVRVSDHAIGGGPCQMPRWPATSNQRETVMCRPAGGQLIPMFNGQSRCFSQANPFPAANQAGLLIGPPIRPLVGSTSNANTTSTPPLTSTAARHPSTPLSILMEPWNTKLRSS